MWTTILTQTLPELFSIIGFILDQVKASNDVKAKFEALRKQVEVDMLIPTQGRDEFQNQDRNHENKP